jgi:hypothetical protein
MSDADQAHFPDFGKLVPGFDFLKNLSGQAAASAPPAMPGMPQLGAWVAPTLDVEELDKRIAELKAVQFWLDQNAAALKATIQALEVQKMTLVALQGMNVNMNEMAQAFTARMPGAAPAPEPAAKPPAAPDSSAKAAEGGAAIDPMQWWGALTQQFQSIAQAAIKDASVRNPSTAAPRTGKKSATPKSATKAKAKAKAKAPAGRTSTTQAKAPARKAAPRSR